MFHNTLDRTHFSESVPSHFGVHLSEVAKPKIKLMITNISWKFHVCKDLLHSQNVNGTNEGLTNDQNIIATCTPVTGDSFVVTGIPLNDTFLTPIFSLNFTSYTSECN